MSSEVIAWALGIAATVVSGVMVFYLQRSQKKRDKKEEQRLYVRQTETRLMIDLQLATAKLSYAVAMAIKRGTPNGEVEDGIKAYDKALEEFREFERDQISRI